MKSNPILTGLLLALLYAFPGFAETGPSRGVLQKYRMPPAPVLQSEAVVELGRMLFFDRRLSGDGTMSCATCHIPGEDGFADGREFSAAYPTNAHFRNTPTVVNAVLRSRLAWDGRAGSAKEQALGPIGSPFEMNIQLDLLIEKLRSEPRYVQAFQEAFYDDVTAEGIAGALAAFEGLLVSSPSPFDRYLDGEDGALTPGAKRGMGLFFGKGGCTDCHDGPQLGGDRFASLGLEANPKMQTEPMRGVSLRYFARSLGHRLEPGAEEDLGRYFVTGEEADKGRFLVPTLRQLQRTAPYGHDGRFPTLEAVIELLDQGGGSAPHRAKKLKPLDLTPEEKATLVDFLQSLTGPDPKIAPPRSLY